MREVSLERIPTLLIHIIKSHFLIFIFLTLNKVGKTKYSNIKGILMFTSVNPLTKKILQQQTTDPRTL